MSSAAIEYPVREWSDVYHRLVSFENLVRHYGVWQLGKAITDLKDIQHSALRACDAGCRDVMVPHERMEQLIKPVFEYTRMQCEQIDLKSAISRIDGPTRNAFMRPVTYDVLCNHIQALLDAIESELCNRRFAFVPDAKAKVLDVLGNEWKPVWNVLPDAERDATDAVECYALDKNTASVFHSMRVAEHCVRALAKRLRVTLTHKGQSQPIDFADWGKVITGCNNAIARAREMSPGQKQQGRLELYSDAAQHCLFMKDIWRNNISHTRKPYNEGEAIGVLIRVRDFALFVATKVL